MDTRQKLLAIFEVEQREHLESIRATLARLEASGVSEGPRADLDEAFRRAHSLKGAARAVDLGVVQTLAHRLETLFTRVREGAVPLDRRTLAVTHATLDAVEDWFGAFASGRAPAVPRAALEAVAELVGAEPEAAAPDTRADVPARDAAGAAADPAPPARAVDASPTLRVRAEHLDRLVRSTAELLADLRRQDEVAAELAALGRELATLERSEARSTGARSATGLTRRLRGAALLQRRAARSLGQRTARIEEDARHLRVVPAADVWQGIHKIVRDLAHDEDKEVELRITGLEAEADRGVLQALKDPLMHLLRNAVTHGLERAEERTRAGKSPAGRVEVRIGAAGGRLVVCVEDDGRGLDLRRIARVAAERGLLSPSAAAAAPEDLARLVFRAGFTTAPAAGARAGRGMGMSVVTRAVERLRGAVELRPRDAGGTNVVVSVPLSLSSHHLLMVRCRGRPYGIPTHAIVRLLRVRPVDLETIDGRPVIRVDGEPVPLAALSALLGVDEGEPLAADRKAPLVVLAAEGRRAAISVDALLDARPALVKALPGNARHDPTVDGVVVGHDGSVILVLRAGEIVSAAERRPGVALSAAPPEAEGPRVLVVDDSITTRTLEKGVLEAGGFRVRLAVDGDEALAMLRADPVDLVVADLQMPRMDGFTLLQEMKRHRDLARIPVVIVSSRDSPEDKARGLALGADAYIAKLRFDSQDLLDTVRQLL